jgi:transposase
MDKMSAQQWKRLEAVRRVRAGELTAVVAAAVVGLSKRQFRRVRRAVEERGDPGVVHGNTGRAPWNKSEARLREKIVRLRRKKFVDFNDHHYKDKLEEENVRVSVSSVRRILRAAGIASPRRHRAPKHHRRRDRKPQAGMMILWDGSPHDWLEERGPRLCLMGSVDDATSELLPGAHFLEQENAAGYLRALRDLVKEKGVPWSAYMDKHSALRRNDDHWTLEEELRGEQDPTHVERALRALGVEIIYAHSPQAKGRVERGWGTHQDRLVSELRLAGAKTAVEANAVLGKYRGEHNRRFGVKPEDATLAWRSRPAKLDLDRVCSFYYEAAVLNDNTVRLGGVVIDIPPGPGGRSYAHARAEVRQLLDGSWRVYYRDQLIATKEATHLDELRALKRRKRSAASRAFRRGVQSLAASLP